MSSTSVSKGVFVFKGSKKSANAESHFCDGRASKTDQERLVLCDDLWEQLHERIQVLQSEMNTQIFEDLVQYVGRAHMGFSLGAEGAPSTRLLQEIPTAALITGVNLPDHAVMFGSLTSLLRERVSPHIAVLKAKDCPNIRSVMAKALGQLMGNSDMQAEDDDAGDPGVNMRRVSPTMSVLEAWYIDTVKRASSSPKKRRSNSGAGLPQYPPVVMVMEDVEGFPPNVMQDFLTICSNHLRSLPIVLVLGIATAVTAVHRLLPHAVSSLLCMEKFQAPPSSEYLSRVINQVVMTSDFPFKLGGKVFNLLLDLFLYHDFSAVNFIRGVQFSLLEHFYSHPYSSLCQPLSNSLDLLKVMTHGQLEQVRRLRSFRSYVESCLPEEQISLLEDDKFTKKIMGGFLERLDSYHENYFPVLHCIHTLTCKLPKYPLGRQLREVYSTTLSTNICDTQPYKDAIALLRTLSRDELMEMTRQCVGHMTNNSLSQELQPVREQLQTYLHKLQHIDELAEEKEEEKDTKSAAVMPKKMDMYTLRQTLQDMEKKKKKLSTYEVLRKDIIDYFDELFRQYLVSPVTLPLHEIYYYNDVGVVRQHMNPSPRATIQTALSNPHYYLQGEAGGPVPDVSVAYRLHLECGRLINLYDWMQAFITVVRSKECGDEDDDDDDMATRKPDKLMQARFIRAVSELQFLGFIKSTKRKTDHVARLTY